MLFGKFDGWLIKLYEQTFIGKKNVINDFLFQIE